ncbi:hypothetical protein HK100_003708, partial [Physocladia obscura]
WTSSAKVGIKKMAEKVLGVVMQKEKTIRTGRWSKKEFSKEEIALSVENITTNTAVSLSPTDSESSPLVSSLIASYQVNKHVLLDPFHPMQQVQKLIPSPKKHPVLSAFMKASSTD